MVQTGRRRFDINMQKVKKEGEHVVELDAIKYELSGYEKPLLEMVEFDNMKLALSNYGQPLLEMGDSL